VPIRLRSGRAAFFCRVAADFPVARLGFIECAWEFCRPSGTGYDFHFYPALTCGLSYAAASRLAILIGFCFALSDERPVDGRRNLQQSLPGVCGTCQERYGWNEAKYCRRSKFRLSLINLSSYLLATTVTRIVAEAEGVVAP